MRTPSQLSALVTGGNRGLGFAIVRLLAQVGVTVTLASRTLERGKAAAEELAKEGLDVDFTVLDATKQDTIRSAARFMKEKHKGCDILICNAGVNFKNEFTAEVARKTSATNFEGVQNCCDIFFEEGALKQNARCIVVSSRAGDKRKLGEKPQNRIRTAHLSIPQLHELYDDYVQSIEGDTVTEDGWLRNTYAVSKIFATKLMKIYARDEARKAQNLQFYACCPGWTRTEMAGYHAPKRPEEGADTPFYLATAPQEELKNGGFYAERRLLKNY
eukprot:m.138211 g.138211  ORF g.138211 m.138211 type:complete len:273 (+) comp24028_c1_seq3:224-1042(+)